MARVSRKQNIKNKKINEKKIKYNVAVYARLSIEDGGKQESDTLETQISLINAFIEKQSDMKVYNTYYDNGETGTKFNRPAFRKMMDDVKERNVNCIVVKDLSRFLRSNRAEQKCNL